MQNHDSHLCAVCTVDVLHLAKIVFRERDGFTVSVLKALTFNFFTFLITHKYQLEGDT